MKFLTRTLLALSALLAAGEVGYRAYLAPPRSPTAPPIATGEPPLADRVVLFVIDGFNPGRAFDPGVMPTLNRLADGGVSGLVHTGTITTTAPCIYSLVTGRPGSLVQAILNFHSAEVHVDSLLTLAVAGGRKVLLSGDHTWHKQFGWIAGPDDVYQAPEPGITLDERARQHDREAVDFLVRHLDDPDYAVSVVHLGSVDAAGHMVTPLGREYAAQLAFADGLLAEVVDALDLSTTTLLVTGDHGMAARGTHGGEGEARRTPFVLAGAGVRAGLRRDVPQTALPATLSVVLGLPLLPVSEHAPLVELLTLPTERAAALRAAYVDGKRRAAGLPSTTDEEFDDAANDRLNEALFGVADSRNALRLLSLALAMLGIAIAASGVHRSTPAAATRVWVLHLGLCLATPVAILAITSVLIGFRGHFAFRSTIIAGVGSCVLALAVPIVASVARRSRGLRAFVGRQPSATFFALLTVASLPLVNSHWLDPQPYACVLLVVSAGVLLWLGGPRAAARRDALAPASQAVLALLFVVGLDWRLTGGTGKAELAIALFAIALGMAVAIRERPHAAATLAIGASAGLYLVLAADAREAVVFLVAAGAALLLSRLRLDLARPGVLHAAVGTAILVRLMLFFLLGDQYRLSSIRTASGFVLADYGLPLASVVTLLLLKYGLPWLLVLGALLPSLATVSEADAQRAIELMAPGYAARLAVVTAVVDPLRHLPNAMDGIVGVYCLTWAEFVAFAFPATYGLVCVARARRPAAAWEPAPAIRMATDLPQSAVG